MGQSRSKKGWRQPGRRQGHRVLAPERHLIVCEGKKTEPNYFCGLREALKPEFRNRIHVVVKGTGLHTIDLLKEAVRENRLSDSYDHVWVVYDCDDFDHNEFNLVAKKCDQYSNDATMFHPLWSNPCIEIWMLLHFVYTTATLTSAEAINRTNSSFRHALGHPYKKADERIFLDLRDRLPQAMKNVNQLERWHQSQGAGLPSEMNPYTAIVDIINHLSDYLFDVKLND